MVAAVPTDEDVIALLAEKGAGIRSRLEIVGAFAAYDGVIEEGDVVLDVVPVAL